MHLKNPGTLLIGLILLGQTVFAQNIEEQIFGEASALLATADSAQAALLSPRNYQRGLAAYERARQEFEQGGNLERIGARLTDASAHFEAAIEAARLARVSLEPALKARDLAAEADASRLVAADWEAAEQDFSRAARALEKGDLKAAQQVGDAVTLGYAEAELSAIKKRVLNETRRLLAEAEQARADRFAPASIGKARGLLARADAALEQNRYETDAPAALAAEASYAARHATYIAAIAQQVDKGQLSMEDIMLRGEAALARLARTADVEADFSAGTGDSVDQLDAELTRLQQIERDLAERDRQVAALEEELWELDQRLGGATAEREALVMRLEEQARVREQFAQVAGTFEPEEATVLRDGDTVILRLVGLTFPSGSARLDAGAAPLMDKVRAAVGIFPRCELTVEGHTDSSGGAQQNLRLSESRAQAVMQYMIENMDIAAYRIKAAGFGDSRPIANNGTAAGRALNRRIDLLIMPRLDR
jgi:outer membrane protein OmpA-like peptidoglycan-associated protein